MDAVDRANKLADFERDTAIAAATGLPPGGPSAKTCQNCGNAIPLKRRAAMPGCTFCVTCQAETES